MSKYSIALSNVIKHWPFANCEDSPLVLKLSEQFALAGSSEEEIKDICNLISDEINDAFSNGINSVNL